ncbi:alpha/beta fold hydrolase [Arthrobacter caoxuetaonis]|uniref:Alpha/beta fold hydrolase n=1 Tax=Arthrobacter caoxuetaonis TaxID=2886935 RepID=A0A9X1MFV4_9MICC|nr:alpha/beta fold hydrolase [Arthrobacter caoxuetaonis]MCC3298440.1 alpha/beta fold hydrolase [Arthrobacter caoxuetaonis]USQ57546.1 alpha/beta fold hydrolase [Arthrobacter caoxuetaonis]
MAEATEHVDVLIIGAGLSGIGAAAHLVRECPGKRYAVLESRGAIGGTWDLFRYPGIRSDSDMYTFGYGFKPWTEPKAISDGESIRRYVEETADEYGITGNIRFHHRILSAHWSTAKARWAVTAERTDTGETRVFTASWVIAATGYYSYEEGYKPAFEGEDRFAGQVVHPQHWPEELDWEGKRVVVIGSGATAVTLVPNLAAKAEHVTMLQRTPTYIASVPAVDPLADVLRRVLPTSVAYPVLRWKNMLSRHLLYSLSRSKPDVVRAKIRKDAIKQLPAGYDVDTHFNPPYNPWDQRVCAVPDGDLFTTLREGHASIVTGGIRSFTETGIELESGEQLPADIIVTATGLNLRWVGGMTLSVDGETVNIGERFAYKGMMLSGVPNLNMVSGYTNNSWTLKADLVSRYACRLLQHLDANGYVSAAPVTPAGETASPFLDLDAGYIRRGVSEMAKQGSRVPWRLHQNYMKDIRLFSGRRLEDGNMVFQRRNDGGARAPRAGAAELQAPHEKFAVVRGGQVRYRDEGEGTPVVLVHGIGRSLEDWNEQHELLSGQGYRVISVDLAGYGESEPLDGAYSLPALAQFLETFLDEAGITEPAHFAGNSLGGAVVMQLAAQSPHRVRSLVLANSAGFGREVALPVRLMSFRPLGKILMCKPSPASARRLELSLFHDPELVTDERVQLGHRLASRPHGTRVFLDTAAALGTIRGTRAEWRRELMEDLTASRVPTLVIWGEQDKIFPFTHLAAAAGQLPHAITHAFSDTGHMPQIERAEEFAKLITGFWAETQANLTPAGESSA